MEIINYSPESVRKSLIGIMENANVGESIAPDREQIENALFVGAFNAMAAKNHAAMRKAGFWQMREAIPSCCYGDSCGEMFPDVHAAAQRAVDIQDLALMHEEISEAVSAVRHNNPPSEKISGFSHVEEELADCILRIADYSAGRGLRVAEALIAKMDANLKRGRLHGKSC